MALVIVPRLICCEGDAATWVCTVDETFDVTDDDCIVVRCLPADCADRSGS